MTETAGNGHYWRDRAGVWRYTISGEPVPGARPRQLFDAEHDYPRIDEGGVRYVAVPRWRLDARPELVGLCAQEGVLVEEDATAQRLLVPEWMWPDAPDPAGGMWAPELSPDQLMDARAAARLLEYAGVDVIWELLGRGVLPAPVVRLAKGKGRPKGMPRTAPTTFWTRPVLEQWKARYREISPLRGGEPAVRRAHLRRRALERLASLREHGRVPKRRRLA